MAVRKVLAAAVTVDPTLLLRDRLLGVRRGDLGHRLDHITGLHQIRG
jgi:hypothetical protein